MIHKFPQSPGLLEVLITYSCNLSCTGCTNYADYAIQGYVSWDEGEHWLKEWSKRIQPNIISLLGGEPFLNPDLDKWLEGTRKYFPSAFIQLTTNGLLLQKKANILRKLESLGNCYLKISQHVTDEEFRMNLDFLQTKYEWQYCNENKWYKTYNNFSYSVWTDKIFWKTFKGTFEDMIPYSSDPNKSYEICVQKECPVMYDGKLWKCSSTAMLRKVLQDWGHLKKEQWQPYLNYKGLDIDATEEQLVNWLDNYKKPFWTCKMCPTRSDNAEINHLNTVQRKTQVKLKPRQNPALKRL